MRFLSLIFTILLLATAPSNATINFVNHTVDNGANGAYSVYATDIDGDNDVDILVGSTYDDTIAWYAQQASGTFVKNIVTTTADLVKSVYAIDLDSDGDVDILSASDNDNTLAWYENDGSSSFTIRTITNTASGAISVYATDIDDDGNVDVILASYDNDTVALYENNGSQTFTPKVINNNANGVSSVYAIDIDGDNDIDILSASVLDDTVAWYENDAGTFTTRVITTSANGARSVYAIDLDSDGDMDILAAAKNDDTIYWYENNGSQVFSTQVITSSASDVVSVYASDIDSDGDIDVLSASSVDNKIAWYENDGNENFSEQIINANASVAVSVYATDIDGDGDIDVLSASSGNDDVIWYENTGTNTFRFTNEHLIGNTFYDVFFKDENSENVWKLEVANFATTTFTHHPYQQASSVMIGTWTITSEGYLELIENDNSTLETNYIKAIEVTNDYIRIDFSSTRTGLNQNANEYLFFDQNKAVTFLNQQNQSTTYTLNVSTAGSGTITSNPAGINCGNTCSTTFTQSTAVTLTANPNSGYVFNHWSGSCSGNHTAFTLILNTNTSCQANFGTTGSSNTNNHNDQAQFDTLGTNPTALTYPNGDEQAWIAGVSQTITWDTSHFSGNINLYVLRDNAHDLANYAGNITTLLASKTWHQFASNINNTGSYTVNPNILGDTDDQYVILITSTDGSVWDISNNTFVVLRPVNASIIPITLYTDFESHNYGQYEYEQLSFLSSNELISRDYELNNGQWILEDQSYNNDRVRSNNAWVSTAGTQSFISQADGSGYVSLYGGTLTFSTASNIASRTIRLDDLEVTMPTGSTQRGLIFAQAQTRIEIFEQQQNYSNNGSNTFASLAQLRNNFCGTNGWFAGDHNGGIAFGGTDMGSGYNCDDNATSGNLVLVSNNNTYSSTITSTNAGTWTITNLQGATLLITNITVQIQDNDEDGNPIFTLYDDGTGTGLVVWRGDISYPGNVKTWRGFNSTAAEAIKTAIINQTTIGSAPNALTSPNGGENWVYDSTQTITWNNQQITGGTVDLYVLHDNTQDLYNYASSASSLLGNKNWYKFGTNISNTGSHTINPRNLNGNGNQYVVLILADSDSSQWDVSDGVFSLMTNQPQSGSTTYNLNVSRAGSGTITSNPAGINCGNTCSTTFTQSTAVTLTANPNSGYVFNHWSGSCSGNHTAFTLILNTNTSCQANFGTTGSSNTNNHNDQAQFDTLGTNPTALTYPNGDEQAWIAGVSQTITWDTSHFSGNINLYVLRDNAHDLANYAGNITTLLASKTWHQFASNINNTGSYTVNPNILGDTDDQYVILITSTDGSVWDISNNTFVVLRPVNASIIPITLYTDFESHNYGQYEYEQLSFLSSNELISRDYELNNGQWILEDQSYNNDRVRSNNAWVSTAGTQSFISQADGSGYVSLYGGTLTFSTASNIASRTIRLDDLEVTMPTGSTQRGLIFAQAQTRIEIFEQQQNYSNNGSNTFASLAQLRNNFCGTNGWFAGDHNGGIAFGGTDMGSGYNCDDNATSGNLVLVSNNNTYSSTITSTNAGTWTITNLQGATLLITNITVQIQDNDEDGNPIFTLYDDGTGTGLVVWRGDISYPGNVKTWRGFNSTAAEAIKTAIINQTTIGSAPNALTSPNGGENWVYDSTQTITWNNQQITGGTVDLYVLHDNTQDLYNYASSASSLLGNKNWYKFGTNISNTGSHTINPRNLNGNGNQYVVLILADSDSSQWDVSDGVFSLMTNQPQSGSTTYNLNVSRAGSGTITSNPAGINCGNTCSTTFTQSTAVTLTANPNSGYVFNHWSGSCSGNHTAFTLILNTNTSCQANFGTTGSSNTNNHNDQAQFDTLGTNPTALTYPNGDEQAWIAGVSQTITWDTSHFSGNINLYVLRDNAHDLANYAGNITTLLASKTWHQFASNINNTGSYTVNPNILGDTDDQYVILITSTDGSVWDISNNTFVVLRPVNASIIPITLYTDFESHNYGQYEYEQLSFLSSNELISRDYELNNGQWILEDQSYNNDRVRSNNAWVSTAGTQSFISQADGSGYVSLYGGTLTFSTASNIASRTIRLDDLEVTMPTGSTQRGLIFAQAQTRIEIFEQQQNYSNNGSNTFASLAQLRNNFCGTNGWFAGDHNGGIAFGGTDMGSGYNCDDNATSGNLVLVSNNNTYSSTITSTNAGTWTITNLQGATLLITNITVQIQDNDEDGNPIFTLYDDGTGTGLVVWRGDISYPGNVKTWRGFNSTAAEAIKTAIINQTTIGSAPNALTSPNGGENWVYDSTQTITWNNQQITGGTVDLYVLHDNTQDLYNYASSASSLLGNKNWYKFGTNISNTGSHTINPRNLNGNGNQYVVLILADSDSSQWDVSDGVFSLMASQTQTSSSPSLVNKFKIFNRIKSDGSIRTQMFARWQDQTSFNSVVSATIYDANDSIYYQFDLVSDINQTLRIDNNQFIDRVALIRALSSTGTIGNYRLEVKYQDGHTEVLHDVLEVIDNSHNTTVATQTFDTNNLNFTFQSYPILPATANVKYRIGLYASNTVSGVNTVIFTYTQSENTSSIAKSLLASYTLDGALWRVDTFINDTRIDGQWYMLADTVNAIPVIAQPASITLQNNQFIHLSNGVIPGVDLRNITTDESTSTLQFSILNASEAYNNYGISIGHLSSNSSSFIARSDNSIHIHPSSSAVGVIEVIIQARNNNNQLSLPSTWTITVINPPASSYALTTNISGSGTITSNPAGINCGSDCSQTYNTGTAVTLTANPDTGYVFNNWGGSCSGNNTIFTFVLNTDTACQANFVSSVDTDGDGIPDVTDTDDDNDGLPDTFETANGLDPLDASDASSDLDGDGFSNLEEYQFNTLINDSSSIPLYQTVAVDGGDRNILPNSTVSLSVNYSVSDNDNTLTGLGLRVHFNQANLLFVNTTNTLLTGFITANSTPIADSNDFDNNPNTSHYIGIAWSSAGGNWPNQTLPSKLFDINFLPSNNFTVGSSTIINFSVSSLASGYEFKQQPSLLTLSDLNLDIDGNNTADALTDGLLVIRYLFGFRGNTLISNVVDSNATRVSITDIENYLSRLQSSNVSDIDGNNNSDALTDGLLIIRYLFGFRNDTLTSSATATGSSRSGSEIEGYLQSITP